MKLLETKSRSIIKSISWRAIALSNSWIILMLMSHRFADNNFYKALAMNITAFIFYYLFERLWNKIKYGKYIENENN